MKLTVKEVSDYCESIDEVCLAADDMVCDETHELIASLVHLRNLAERLRGIEITFGAPTPPDKPWYIPG